MLAMFALALRTHFGLTEWGFIGILSAACLVLGRMNPGYARISWVAFALTGLLLAGWAATCKPEELQRVWLVAGGFGALWSMGAWLCHLGSATPGEWAWLSALSGLWAFGACWIAWRPYQEPPVPWGILSLGLGVVYLGAALFGAVPRRRLACGENQLAAFCVAVTGFASLAVPLELDRHWISVAWALQAAALAWLLTRVKARALGALSVALAVCVTLRLLLNPAVFDYPIGATPVLNWILYGYGIPVLAFALGARWMEKAQWKGVGTAYWWASGAFLFALLTLEVRHAFHPTKILEQAPDLWEAATYSHAWLIAAVIILWAGRGSSKAVWTYIGLLLAVVASIKILLFDLAILNPLWEPIDVGSLWVWNGLLYIYALPVAALALSAWLLDDIQVEGARTALAWLAGVLAFVLLGLQVRNGFHPLAAQGPTPSIVEWATYSHLWLAAALALLWAHKRWGIGVLQQIGTAFGAIAVLKVVLIEVLFQNPLWNHANVGTWFLVNWLLYAYGPPLLGFALLRSFARTEGKQGEALADFLHWGILLVLFAGISLQLRQVFHGAYLDSGVTSFFELVTYSHAWLLLAGALLLAWKRWGRGTDLHGGRLIFILSLLKILLVDAVALSPLAWHRSVGEMFLLNGVLYGYGVPIALLWILDSLSDRKEWRCVSRPAASFGSLLLGFVLVSLEVRQYYQGAFLDGAHPLSNENYAYSAAWILFSLFLLALGIWKGGKVPRVASLLVVFLAVGKVFLYDLRHLQGLYKAASPIGLGVCLLLISFLYQRFVFRGPDHDDAA